MEVSSLPSSLLAKEGLYGSIVASLLNSVLTSLPVLVVSNTVFFLLPRPESDSSEVDMPLAARSFLLTFSPPASRVVLHALLTLRRESDSAGRLRV